MLLVMVLLQMGCSVFTGDKGYFIIHQQVSKDSAVLLKNSINGSVSNDVFQPLVYKEAGNSSLPYRMLAPETLSGKQRYPLVLVLHGSGAVGTDNVAQLGILAKLWAQPGIRAKYPAYVVAPQFPQRSSSYVMDKNLGVLVSSPGACLTTALQLVDSLKKALPVDERKIYVVGFSMGASSVINAVSMRPGLFAAGVAVSGIPSFTQLDNLKNTPLWIVHGNADTENPMASDSLLHQQLHAKHADHQLKYWEVVNLDHSIYNELYSGDALPKWLFKHGRKR
ncbi:carboxylesterase family protein [Deminuibacter soli]|nr:alpha/beta hydrolase-fold protein [Deminuibacter soli]